MTQNPEGARGMTGPVPVYCSFTELVPIDKVVPNPKNPNNHPSEQIKRLAKVIKGNGWRLPITVSTRSGLIVKGHGRLMAAKKLNLELVPVDYQHYDSEELEIADLIADNQIPELAEMNNTQLMDLVQEIDTGIIDLTLTGFSMEEIEAKIQAMTGSNDIVPGGEDDIPPVPEEPITKLGDLILLGAHRLICGDATDPAVIRRLMNGEQAQMVHTDPPYGVSYQSQSGKFEMIKNDDKTHDELMAKLLLPAFKNMMNATKDDGAFYIWHASSTREDFAYAMKVAGLMEKQYIIWVKNAPVLGHDHYQWAHEPCFYGHKAGNTPKFYGDRAQQTIWRVTVAKSGEIITTLGPGLVLLDGNGGRIFITTKPPKAKKTRHIRLQQDDTVALYDENQLNSVWEVAREHNAEHPTQKPVELARRAIENSSRTGDIVADFFLGSGCTLIGAEMTGRRCYGSELTPHYCDVIVARWERLTGRKAEYISSQSEAEGA